jgi:UPF0755 protein
MRRLIRLLLILMALAVVAVAVVGWWGNSWLRAPIAELAEPTVIEIPRGASVRAVAADLHRRGLLQQPQLWTFWARLTNRAGGLKAGEYELDPGLTPAALLDLLSSGQVILHSITFIEGSTFADIRQLLNRNDAVAATYANASVADIMRALGAQGVHPEGQFFPDTYRFARATTDIELLKVAYRRMQDELQAAWNSRAPDLPLASKYEALILASIVEKETAQESERPLIAGVFVERLRRGMRLQTDPTVIYGIGEGYDGNIRRVDLLRDTPYNTYTRTGLPPTPIALPGLESLRAAVNPKMTGAIFFVATGQGDGSHYFSATLAEHQAAVQRYLRRLRRHNGR